MKPLRAETPQNTGRAEMPPPRSNDAILPGTAVTTCWEYVGKEQADCYLLRNNRNRKMMPSLAGRYAEDMRAGQWLVTHQGIAFDEDGNLIDRQHTLKAISDSRCGQWLLVTRGLPRACAEVIDRGKSRSLAHALQILGFELSSTRDVAMARMMYAGPVVHSGRSTLTDVSMRKFIQRHAEAIAFVASITGRSQLPATITGVLARAYYHVAPEALIRFVQAYRDEIPQGESRPGDRSARALSKALERNSGAGGSDRPAQYRKAQNALRAYLEGCDLKSVHESGEDLYPLPENAGDADVDDAA